MRNDSRVDVGDKVKIEIEFDPKPRTVPMNPEFDRVLAKNKKAKTAFEKLPPSHQKEILRYLNSLKNEEAIERNVRKVILRLSRKDSGKSNFLLRQ